MGASVFNERGFVALTALAASACVAVAVTHHSFTGIPEFVCYLVAILLASSLKVTLPGIDGTLSVSFVFLLIGILEMTYAETLILALSSVLVQSYWRSSKRLRPIQTIFNFSQLVVATSAAYAVFHIVRANVPHGGSLIGLTCAAIVYFGFNTYAMAAIISLSEHKSFRTVWTEGYLWSFPHYLIGAAVSGIVGYFSDRTGWKIALFTLPIIYLIYRSYCIYVGSLQEAKVHAQQMSRLHLRTIEALALAIEAKDQTTHDHLQRVRVYAMELAHDLGLSPEETEALRAASLLHDIGKLAVPEHIISKPGKLTPEEFEKMKIHPTIGAQILEQVQFPYPVVPIVQAHHEKWDGTGYPNGLKANEIPIGARILAAVDCLDALASDRQYRRALPLDEAMAKVISEAGTSFDPRVVQVLVSRYQELEKLAHEKGLKNPTPLTVDIKVERGSAPDAGFEAQGQAPPPTSSAVAGKAATVEDARREAQLLFDLSNGLGPSYLLDDVLSLLSTRIKRLLAYDALAVYILRDGVLLPEYVAGDNALLFSALKIPVGEGLSGWVALNNKPILNGNPSVEPGYLNDAKKFSTLGSALAVPVSGESHVVAVLTVYRRNPDAFTQHDLSILLASTSKVGLTIESFMNPANIEAGRTDQKASAQTA